MRCVCAHVRASGNDDLVGAHKLQRCAAMLRFEGVEDTPVPSRASQHSMTFEEAVERRNAGADVAVALAEPASAAEAPPSAGVPFTREIQVWDPSMMPLAATTHNQDTYKAWPVTPAGAETVAACKKWKEDWTRDLQVKYAQKHSKNSSRAIP